jgi:predicted neuraminidase/predicted dehydrogenase
MKRTLRSAIAATALSLAALASRPPVLAQGPLVSEFVFETAPFASAHASTIAGIPGGLVAAWFGGTREGAADVGIWVSRRVSGVWSPPREVADGVQADGTRHPCWNPVLFEMPNKELSLFYKVGPSPQRWWGMVKTSRDGGQTWSDARKLPDGILGPIKNKPVTVTDGTVIAPASTESTEQPSAWRVHFERTSDSGRTWTATPPLATADGSRIDAIQPSILLHQDGQLQALGRTRSGRVFETWSRDSGRTWTAVALTSLPNPSAGTDAVTLRDGRHLLVYNHTPKGRSPLNVALSRDGKTWDAALVLESNPGEYSYPAVIQTSDGLVHITYTWRRQRIKHVVVNPMTLQGVPTDIRLMTLDPGHFHAGLIQREMYPGVAERVDVFAPLGFDLFEHLKRIASFNNRSERPTSWQTEVHSSADFFERMLRERPGNVVVLSGRNRGKIDRILSSVRAGLHVLGDKPWILRSDDLPKLESALADADSKGVVAYDIMTERFEITSIVQRALVNDRATFGEIVRGSDADPGVYMESVHHLMKVVAGAPNIRPPWFFDTAEQGEGANDIGTHLVDLVQWTLFPDQSIDYRSDIRVLSAQRWPTWIPEADYRRVTGEPGFDRTLAPALKDGKLEYFANTLVSYALRGVHAKLNIIWDWEAPAGGGDTHFAFYKGTRARIEVRQTRADKFLPELYVIPASADLKPQVLAAVRAKIASLQQDYPGVGVEERGAEIHITVPAALRVGHEAHFAQVASNFLKYVRDRRTLPAWERPNMIAKYYVTTKGTELSHQQPSSAAPRLAPR